MHSTFSFALSLSVPLYSLLISPYRLLARMIWLASILVFIAGNITLYILIQKDQQNDLLVWLRVILLDGLFFIMGILLGLCIILVSLTVCMLTRNRHNMLVVIGWFSHASIM